MNEKSKVKVAIIGLGHIGKALAFNLIKGGHPVTISSRDARKLQEHASELGAMATAKDTSEAIKEAEVVIPTIGFDHLQEFYKTYASELEGKVIVDVSNPISPDGNGGFKKIIGENDSAAKILSGYLPKNSKLIKAFGTLGASSLHQDAFSKPELKVLFYASDSINSNDQIEELITHSGFQPFHIGGLEQAIRIEVFGDLHQFGALNGTVTLNEAQSKVSRIQN
jgi:8-hydroxy-5-deazaflavin:NADPH oxidoreductase